MRRDNRDRGNQRNNDKDTPAGLTGTVRNGDFQKALRIFKKKVQQAGVLQELRERTHYVKPSEKRAKAKAAGIARWKKKQRQNQDKGY